MTPFEATPPLSDKDDDEAELNRLKIERVQTVTYSWGGYRYSNARDAIAAARRAERV
jgi:hypothetical protein